VSFAEMQENEFTGSVAKVQGEGQKQDTDRPWRMPRVAREQRGFGGQWSVVASLGEIGGVRRQSQAKENDDCADDGDGEEHHCLQVQ
jgi:hypothetical protein